MNQLRPTVAISTDFLESYAKIPKSQQKKVMSFVTKFRNDPYSSGINYEKLNDAADPQFRSVRIDQDYRGIVMSPEQGNVYVLLWVAKHDDAYDWARRHTCEIHPETGSLQLIQATDADENQTHIEQKEKVDVAPLFSLRDRELLRLGVPEDKISVVKEIRTEDALERLEGKLPKEAFEALYLIAAGSDVQEILQEYSPTLEQKVDTTDFASALQREQSLRSFYVVEDDHELEAMLSAPLEKWRIFLHPSQRRLVNWSVNGPIRVLGGAGTGKTVVAMHRARWLVRNSLSAPDRKILFTTFTANLAVDIQENLRRICSAEDMDRIEVVHIDAWVSRFLKRHRYPHQIVYEGNDQYKKCWDIALDTKPSDPMLPKSFYNEEWDRVILPQRITDEKQYLRARRTGRGVPLTRAQRSAIWPVFEELQIQLHQRGLRTSEDATQDAADLLESGNASLPYDAVVVDEAQDMGPQVMRLIRLMVQKSKNDLFIVGDAHQRIYRRRYTLSACGIEVRGRSRRLKINYRTTEEIRRFATAMLEGMKVDDLDGGEDEKGGYRSLVHGDKPLVEGFGSQKEEQDWINVNISSLLEQGESLKDICIVARTNELLGTYESALRKNDISCIRMSRKVADNRSQDGVRLATMHRVKGLEFRHMMIVAANEGILPLKNAIEKSEDPTENRSSEFSERALFHVSATRAVRQLFVSYYGNPSKFISEI
ncbi:DNA helicase [Thiohalobacter sp. COW1]|uniref:UvrD-helicase domain-containing protein n=1 Tax=Thiohalobacter sp. COW1 TaxID=2795687 RepID=UPI001915178B|nr:UvrD-helicase domain-containing protein [Thiohalobacter sp. COW1]BCO31185.1 DNA helicase [Thiohalobacter sp. COW1]